MDAISAGLRTPATIKCGLWIKRNADPAGSTAASRNPDQSLKAHSPLSRIQRYLQILSNEKHPLRFVISRLLCKTKLNRYFQIERQGYRLRLQPTGLSLSFFVDPEARADDSNALKTLLRPGDTYVDVGANIGHLAIEAALILGKQGKVVAIEAHPKTSRYCEENIALNGLGETIRLINCAVGDSAGFVHFSDNAPSSADQNRVVTSSGLTVPKSRLDELLDVGPIALLKIDVEGYELFVLRGAAALLPSVRAIYFEAWDQHFANYQYQFSDVYDLLAARGFSICRLAVGELVPVARNERFATCENLLALSGEAAADLYAATSSAPKRLQ